VAAARIGGSATTRDLSESAWQDVIDVNLTGAWLTCKAAMPQLIAGGRGGSVVLTSAAAGQRPQPDQAHEVAAAEALAGMAKTLAQELAEYNIRVNVLRSSAGETNQDASALPGINAPGVNVPGAGVPAVDVPGIDVPAVDARRVDTALEAGDTLAFLVSDFARHLTGTVLPADAGALAR
jgi:NAD(P)-dependent dehydrogenase (short-subunit alcohol dehydrogenase family)